MKYRLGIRRGINLGGWLSQCDYSAERINHFIEAEDIARIASWGLDHIRIPVDYNVLEDDNGGYDAPGWERLDWVFAECEKHGLKAVIDLHKTEGFSFYSGEKEIGFFDSEEYQERFYHLWEEMARRYGDMPDRIMFELLNEVTDISYIEAWNRISSECIRRIRKIAPDIYILLGSYDNNSAPAVEALLPPADEKVVFNFHCYDPLHYTHQRASWVPELIDSPFVPFEDSGTTEEYFEDYFSKAIETAEKYGAELYCGEYGVIDQVPAEDAVKWYKTINAVFEKHGIARAVWSYKHMAFGVIDKRWDAVRDELIKVL